MFIYQGAFEFGLFVCMITHPDQFFMCLTFSSLKELLQIY